MNQRFFLLTGWGVMVFVGFVAGVTWPTGTTTRLHEFFSAPAAVWPVIPGLGRLASNWIGPACSILMALGVILSAGGTGSRLAGFLRLPVLEKKWLVFAAGGALASLWFFGLGLAGLFFLPLLWASLVPGIWWALVMLLRLRWEGETTPFPGWLKVCAGLTVMLWALAVLVPEPGIDAYLYHLRLPFYYLLHHRIYSVWHHIHAHVPQLWEILLAAFPKELSATGGQALSAVTALAIWKMAAGIEKGGWGSRAAVLLALSSPLAVGIGASAYTDLPLMWLGFGSFLLLLGGKREPGTSAKFWSGAVLGLACSLKYAAFPVVAAALVFVAVKSVRRRTPWWGLPGVLGFGAVFWPWLAWNGLATGNPVSPFLGGLFPHALPALPFAARLSEAVFKRTFLAVLASPWVAFVDCEPFLFLSPWFLVVAPLLLFRRRLGPLFPGSGVWLAVCFISWAFFIADERFILAAIPVLALLIPFPASGRAGKAALAGLLLLNFYGCVRQTLFPLERLWAALGLEGRDAYLRSTLKPAPGYWDAAAWLNASTAPGDRVLFVSDYKSQFVWRECIHDHVYDYPTRLNYILWKTPRDPGRISVRFRQYGIRWLLYLPTINVMRLGQLPDLFPFTGEDARAFGAFWAEHAIPRAAFPYVSVYEISARKLPAHDTPELPGVQDVGFLIMKQAEWRKAVGELRKLVKAYPHAAPFRRELGRAILAGPHSPEQAEEAIRLIRSADSVVFPSPGITPP